MSSQNIEYRIIILGNTMVGKTTLFKKLTSENYEEKNLSTIGVDKKTLNLNIDIKKGEKNINRDFSLSIVDTAGQERYKSIIKGYYRGANGILLMYDITDLESFKSIENWVKSIEDNINPKEEKFIIFLIGNKLDQIGVDEYERQVEEENAKEFCEQKNMIWGGEVSVKTMTQEELLKLFKDYVIKIYGKIGENIVKQQGIKQIQKYEKQKRNRDCCLQ